MDLRDKLNILGDAAKYDVSSIKTMVPESEPYWDFLLKELSALGVIVDESEYLERAMLASDYLISDPSSVVIMWEETGKPYTKIRG